MIAIVGITLLVTVAGVILAGIFMHQLGDEMTDLDMHDKG
jgi:hypothetical protein